MLKNLGKEQLEANHEGEKGSLTSVKSASMQFEVDKSFLALFSVSNDHRTKLLNFTRSNIL